MLNKDLLSAYISPMLPIKTRMKPYGKPKGKIKCVLFDIYGTLFISDSGDISKARKKSQPAVKIETLLKKFSINISSDILLKDFFTKIEKKHAVLKQEGKDFPEVEIDTIWMDVLKTDDKSKARAFAIEYELIVNPVYPMPHLRKLLSELKRKKIHMGIISNAQFYTPYLFDWFLDSNLKNLGFHKELLFFSFLFRYAKPSLFLFKHAAEALDRMSVQPDSVVFLGNDMLNDIHPAQAIGFQTALFAGDARSLRLRRDQSLCKTLKPDFVITDLLQLLDYT